MMLLYGEVIDRKSSSYKITLSKMLTDLIDDKMTLFLVMAWCSLGDG